MTPEIPPGLRILFVLNSLELGGAERQACLLASELKGRYGSEVTVAALTEGELTDDVTKPVVRLCQNHGIPWRVLGNRLPDHPRDYLRWFNELRQELRKLQPDVLMPYCILPNVACGITWEGTGARTCIWNQRDEGVSRLSPCLERLAAWGTSWFISNSAHGYDYLSARFGVRPYRSRVIPNGVALPPPALSPTAWRGQLGIGLANFSACMMANLHRRKDHHTLIRAWRGVVDRCSAANMERPVLVLAGYFNNTAKELQALTNQLALGADIRFIGRTDDVAGLLGAMDACVHISELEGLPNAILEAMAAGLPVIATDIPGSRQALGPDCAKWLVPPKDPEVLADRIFELASKESMRQALGVRNRERVQTQFGVRRLAQETLNVISMSLSDAYRLSPRRRLVTRLRGIALSLVLVELSVRETARRLIHRFISRTPLLWRLLRH
jgi:glycosyltransferase involved in cell wall biosynthesis